MRPERIITIRGDVVLRPAGPWTPTVHALLRHLHAQNLPVPEPLELSDTTEILRVVHGDAGDDAWRHQTAPSALRSSGRLLRAIHDGTRSWVPPAGARWAVPVEGGQVIAHGDVKPPNMAWRAGRAVGLFDWDSARPAQPLSDIAYALYWFTPFDADRAERKRRGLKADTDWRGRIEAFLEGYGWDADDDVYEAICARRVRAIDEVEHFGCEGFEPAATWVRQGWPEVWRSQLPPKLPVIEK